MTGLRAPGWSQHGTIVDQLSPGEYRTLAEKAFSALHRAILTGALKPGERMPIEEMATELGMSPMPVREAVRRLDLLGLVENIPHKGARVTELSLDDLRGVYELRLALEPLAIYRAAECFTEEDEHTARMVLDEMDRHSDGTGETWRAHSAFHLGIYAVSGSSWLMRLIQPLWESNERYRLAIPVKTDGSRRNEHERVLQACSEHDPPRAAAEMYNHLATTANALAKKMGSEPLFGVLGEMIWTPPTLPAT